MIKIKINTNKTLSWPNFCVLCLKPTLEKQTEIGDEHIPYCKNCMAKIARLPDWESSIEVITAGWIGFILGIVYLGSIVYEKGWIELLNIKAWGGALGIILISGFIIFIILLLLMFLISPILLKIFPDKIATWGVKITKNKETNITTLEFSNSEYAKKFQKSNGL